MYNANSKGHLYNVGADKISDFYSKREGSEKQHQNKSEQKDDFFQQKTVNEVQHQKQAPIIPVNTHHEKLPDYKSEPASGQGGLLSGFFSGLNLNSIKNIFSGIFSNFKTDDLLLILMMFLILNESKEDDYLVLLVLAVLFFT